MLRYPSHPIKKSANKQTHDQQMHANKREAAFFQECGRSLQEIFSSNKSADGQHGNEERDRIAKRCLGVDHSAEDEERANGGNRSGRKKQDLLALPELRHSGQAIQGEKGGNGQGNQNGQIVRVTVAPE